jgi:hypothetical protein
MQCARLVVVACLLVSGLARAQGTPVRSLPPVLPSPLTGDLGRDNDAFSGFRLTSPVRLSLTGSIFPKAGQFPQCSTLEDDVGNAVGGIPVLHYRELHLLPHLFFGFFSQLGCPIDAGLGAAFAYAVPLSPGLAFAVSGGMYAAPGQSSLFGGSIQSALLRGVLGQQSSAGAALRADLTWQTPGGHPLGLGLESRGGAFQGIHLSGGF